MSPAGSTQDSRRLAAAGIRAALDLARCWGLSDPQLAVLLGLTGTATLRRWRSGIAQDRFVPRPLGTETLDRIRALQGIYRALHILLTDPAQADSWIHRPNQGPGFDGAPALQRMLRGGLDDLRYVRNYLDGWCS